MRTFKRILCPLDFSEASRHAFQYAKAFAECFEAEPVLLHVSPNIAEAYTALMPEFPVLRAENEADLMEQFNDFTGDWAGKLQKVIRAGAPYREILEYARAGAFDLIILGAKGRSNFERLFLGSTSEKVVAAADIPVLTVHPKPHGLPIRRILVPIDFSAHSFQALPYVAAIAEKFRAEIYLLHVVEIGHPADAASQARQYDYFERLRAKLEDQWDLPAAFHRIETHKFIRHHVGSPGYGILEFAQDWDVDLIAMTTHGRTGLSRMWMGSVTEKVIRIAPYPVLSIRSKLNQN